MIPLQYMILQTKIIPVQNISTKYAAIKTEFIPDGKLIQLQYESDTMKRLLGFMMDENTHLKNRLSEVLKAEFNKNLLDEVELFLSRFIKEDELIGLLRNDLAELDKLLVKSTIGNESIKKLIYKKMKNLENNILVAEQQFNKLKLEFNNYLSVNM